MNGGENWSVYSLNRCSKVNSGVSTTVTSIQQSQIQVHDIATARVEPSGVRIPKRTNQTACLVPEPNGSGNETRPRGRCKWRR